ncbi:MAG TPA: DUF418 domain-containing protein [Steroidobacteraceae bacterium]|nr:DUF418 domain-containing protein [Steroidobacteraceae bacterium]
MLDALRGFALLGIVITHMPDFSGYSFLPPANRHALDQFGVGALLPAVAEFLIRGKFFSLFSFLFGIGFAVQIDSAVRRGANFNRHFTRRLAALFAIGLAHACLWYGDILKDYALIGLFLLLTPRWSVSMLARVTVGVLVLRVAWPAIMWAVIPTSSPNSNANPVAEFDSLTNAFYGTDPIAIFNANLELVRLKALQMIYDGRAISVFGMFLIGALVGRMRLYQNLSANTKLISRVFFVRAPLGVLGNAALVPLHAATPDYPPTGMWVAEQCVFSIAVPAMALSYASGFALLWMRGWQPILRVLAPAGRMALTTYVSETLIGMFLFYGIGLGFGNRFGFVQATAVAVTIFAIQCVASRIWLHYFRFGPLEWIWRRATYGTPVAIARRSEIKTA